MLQFSVFRKSGQTGNVTVPQIGTQAFDYFIIVD